MRAAHLGVLAGYGYKTHFALYWAIGIWLLGAAQAGEEMKKSRAIMAREHPPADNRLPVH